MKQVKITVLKTSFEKDLAERYAMPGLGPCTAMKEGQVFVTDSASRLRGKGRCRL